MTLDEAIRHAEKVAERLETSCKRDWMGEDDERCASEHRQLAEWLKDYKRLLEQESVLDKIRAEIEGKYRVILKGTPKDDWAVKWSDCLDEVLQVIDKYKAESEKV